MAVEAEAEVAQQVSWRSDAFAGLGIAAHSVTAAFLLGLSGIIFAWGYDGLAFVLGLGAGVSLLQLLIAPRLALVQSRTLWGYFNERYRCRVLRVLSAGAIALSVTTMLAALLMAAGIIVARWLGVDLSLAIAGAALAMFACYAGLDTGFARMLGAGAFLVLAAVLLTIAMLLSAQYYGLPLPHVAYANALWQVQGLEETLLEQGLADPAMMKPLLAPFMMLNPLTFGGIVLGLAAGLAAWPGVAPYLVRRTPEAAQRTSLWGLVIVVIVLTLAPALAAYGRLAFTSLIADQTSAANLPHWVFAYGAHALVDVCGRPALDVSGSVAACADLADASPVLRVQDVTPSPDIVVLALPEMAGMSVTVAALLAIVGLAALLLTARGQLGAAVDAVLGAARGWDANGAGSRLPGYGVGAALLALAAAGAALHPATVVETGAMALVLAASALFPALAGGLWWRRANAVGAVASLIVGLGLAFAYLIGKHYFPVPFYEATSGLSAAGGSGWEYFVELKETWLAAEGAEKQEAWIALEQFARDAADWWGIGPLAVALIALPGGFLALIAGSLLTGRRAAVTAA